LVTSACKKSASGFLSPYIHYEVDPILIPKGRNFLSAGLNGDGTSQPFTCKVLHFYDKATGKNVDTMFAHTYPVPVWTALYNPKTDTTLALINAKRQIINSPAIAINPKSGQITSNFGALNLPGGEYQFDLEITNEAGTKTYPKIGDFILKDTTTFDAVPALGTQYDRLYQTGNENVTILVGVPTLNITRLADTPNIVTVQFLDKNGVYFNPSKGEIIARPSGNTYLQTLEQYAVSHRYTNNSMIFSYAFTPFPLNSLGNGFNIYYRIPGLYANVDGYPAGSWSLNPRFPVRFYVPGSYLITMQFPDVTHAP
jgi:hypothetical protein